MRFFVGQRVRVVHCNGWPELIGEEGRIARFYPEQIEGRSHGCWGIAPDAWRGEIAPYTLANGANAFGATSDQIEPILPEGHKPCEEQFKRDLDRLLEREGVSA